jgi:hypothetical protein
VLSPFEQGRTEQAVCFQMLGVLLQNAPAMHHGFVEAFFLNNAPYLL